MQTLARPPAQTERLAGMPANREFDLWLQRELGRLHGDVLHEPVPDRLMRIIEESVGPQD